MTEQAPKDSSKVLDFRTARLRRALRRPPEDALPIVEQAASEGLAEAQYELARLFVNRDADGDLDAAKRWYQAASDQGHVEASKALWRLNFVTHPGGAIEVVIGDGSIEQSLGSIIRAADLGDRAASGILIHVFGKKPEMPIPNMPVYLERHVALGQSYAQVAMAHAYAEGWWKLEVSEEKAFELYMRAAGNGHAHAMYCVGIGYAFGRGVSKDDDKAVYWYEKSARAGSAAGQCNLGYCHEIGRGPLKKSMQEANRWYRRAALRDFEGGQHNLGLSYLHGRELPQDFDLANRWFARAAEQGYAKAQIALGASYEKGRGVEVSHTKALELYKAAGESGDEEGQYCYHRLATRDAMNELEARLKASDPQYAAKLAALMPILRPVFKHLHPSKWVIAFEEAYAEVTLPLGLVEPPRHDPMKELEVIADFERQYPEGY